MFCEGGFLKASFDISVRSVVSPPHSVCLLFTDRTEPCDLSKWYLLPALPHIAEGCTFFSLKQFSKQSILVLCRIWWSFILLKLSTLPFLGIIFQSGERKTVVLYFRQCAVKRNGNRPEILQYYAAPRHHFSFFMDQQTTIDLCPCLHFHPFVLLSIYLFVPVLLQQCFHVRNGWKNKQKERKGRAQPYPSDTKLTLIPGTQWIQPPAPLGHRANNTHNAACLWLLESPAAIFVLCQRSDARQAAHL